MNEPDDQQFPEKKFSPPYIYSENGFMGQSIILTIICVMLVYWLTTADGWQAAIIAVFTGVIVFGPSCKQGTVIENIILLILFTLQVLTPNPFFYRYGGVGPYR